MMRSWIVVAVAVVLMHSPARGQTADASDQSHTQFGQALGVIGAPANAAAPAYVPMTASERFRHYLRSTYSPGSVVGAAAAAGITQWEDKPKEWKQGAEGYGDRVGNAYAIHVMRGTIEYGASALLHEDDRYVRSPDKGFWKRSKHAVGEIFIARNDAGHERFAFSRFGGAAGAAFISRIWQPHSTNSAGDGAVVFGINMGLTAGNNLFHEFWPDIKRHVFKKD